MQRKLTAIMAADVVGYSALMGIDEANVLDALKKWRANVFAPSVKINQGRIVKLMGDGAIVEFASVIDALTCAVDLQTELSEDATVFSDGSRLRLRIGINLGDVIVDDGDLYGDGVNVAARLESLAKPGAIAVSEIVAQQARGKIDVGFEDLGEHRLKNIADPVRIFEVRPDGTSLGVRRARDFSKRISIGALITLAVVGFAIWWLALNHTSDKTLMIGDSNILAKPYGPTIAVLPFQNLGHDADQNMLAVGIGEDIIVELGKYQDLNVLSRQSTHALSDEKVDLTNVEQELGADYVLLGTVRLVGDKLRVTARLVETSTGLQVWSDAFDDGLTASNILDVQLAITEKVASAVGDAGGAIKRIHASHARAKPPENMSSYECSLLRVGFINRRDMQERVRECILRVVEQEPDYWRGWTQLAEALLTDAKLFTGLYEGANSEKIRRAEEAARTAISLNPYSARSHFVLAVVLQIQRDLDGFFSAAETALAVGADRYLQGQIGYEFIWAGRLDDGAALIENAVALDPNAADPNWFQALAEYHFLKGDYEAALQSYRKGAQPGIWWSVMIEVAILAQLGRQDEARAALDRLNKLRPGITIGDIVWVHRRFARPEKDILPFVEAYRLLGMPQGQFTPFAAGTGN